MKLRKFIAPGLSLLILFAFVTSIQAGSGPDISSNWTAAPPTIDGAIDPVTEWASATVLDTSLNATPVTLYLMNVDNYLYLALDDQNNNDVLGDGIFAVYFDDEGGVAPILYNNAFDVPCDSNPTEGGIGTGARIFSDHGFDPAYTFGSPGGGECGPIVPSPEATSAWALTDGRVQYEMQIDLTTGNLLAQPGQTFGVAIVSTDNFGITSALGGFENPSNFANLTLATRPVTAAIPTVSEWGMIILSLLLVGIAFWFIRQEQRIS